MISDHVTQHVKCSSPVGYVWALHQHVWQHNWWFAAPL